MPDAMRIAHWTFYPETGILQNSGETVRLEHRAAALLGLLARQPGRLVSHAEIISEVWQGRIVSANSVAVVISDIRRALADDPRAPEFVETLPKRGYRLIADTSVSESATEGPREPIARRENQWRIPALLSVVVTVFAAMILGRSAVFGSSTADRIPIAVAVTINETADQQFDPLATSVTEVLTVSLGQHAIFTHVGDTDADVRVHSKLVLWDGHPSMSIHAQSTVTQQVLWSGMAKGPETLLPEQISEQIAALAAVANDSGLEE